MKFPLVIGRRCILCQMLLPLQMGFIGGMAACQKLRGVFGVSAVTGGALQGGRCDMGGECRDLTGPDAGGRCVVPT